MLDKLELSEHTVVANGFRVHLVLNKVTAIMGGIRFPVVAVDPIDDNRWILVRWGKEGWLEPNLGPGRYYFIGARLVRFEVEPGCLTE